MYQAGRLKILCVGWAVFLFMAGPKFSLQNKISEIDWIRYNTLQSLGEKYQHLADSYKAMCIDIEKNLHTGIMASPAQDQRAIGGEDDELLSGVNPYLFQRWAEEHHSPKLSEIFAGKPRPDRILKRIAPSILAENLEAKDLFDRFLSSFISWKIYEKLRGDVLDLNLIFHESFDGGKLERWQINTLPGALFFDGKDKVKGECSLRIETGKISSSHSLSTSAGTLNHSPTTLRISWFSKVQIRQWDTAGSRVGLNLFGVPFFWKRNGPDLQLLIFLANLSEV